MKFGSEYFSFFFDGEGVCMCICAKMLIVSFVVNLPGSFAVWCASPEATFLHGRFLWSAWDVDELSQGQLRKKIDEDVRFLRVGVHGLTLASW